MPDIILLLIESSIGVTEMLNKPMGKSEQSADLLPLLVILSEEPNGIFKNMLVPLTLFLLSAVLDFRTN